MIFKIHHLQESTLINQQFSYSFKDFRGLSEWNDSYIWSYVYDTNQYSYFYWYGSPN